MEKKMKLVIFSAVFMLFFAGSVTAIWIMSLNTPTITANIVSSESSAVLTFSVELSDIALIDATNGPISNWTTGQIQNNNGELLNFSVTITDNVTDTEDDCVSDNDITTEWKIDGKVVENNDVINLSSGTTPILWNVSAVQNACPGTATGQLSLIQ